MPNSKPVSTSVAPSAKNTASVSDDESGDYVWDVFYHRPVTLSEWNSVATRTGTLYVVMLAMLDTNHELTISALVCLGPLLTLMIQIQIPKKKMKQMKIRMVSEIRVSLNAPLNLFSGGIL